MRALSDTPDRSDQSNPDCDAGTRRGETLLLREGKTIALGSKERRQLDRHDIVSMRLAGAGGYGPPQERDRELLRKDLARGLVSAQAARDSYGCDDEHPPARTHATR